eukprot:2759541-Rhodomonas_salina.1
MSCQLSCQLSFAALMFPELPPATLHAPLWSRRACTGERRPPFPGKILICGLPSDSVLAWTRHSRQPCRPPLLRGWPMQRQRANRRAQRRDN